MLNTVSKRRIVTNVRSWLFIIFMLTGIGTLFLSIEIQLPDYVPAINPTTKNVLRSIMPQGWAFFTKNPTDPVLVIKAVNSKAIPVSWPIASLSTGWGFNRLGRVQGVQYGNISSLLPSMKNWQTVSETKPGQLKYYTRPNLAPHPLLRGKYIVQYRQFNDWGLSSPNTATIPYKEIGVNIQ